MYYTAGMRAYNMSKIIVLKGGQADKIMNVSANILRNIVSSIVKVDARNVILSGELKPDTSWHEDRGHSWWGGASEDYYSIYGFNPQQGLIKLNIIMSCAYSRNGERQPEGESETLAEYLQRTNQLNTYVFFVEDHSGKEYGDNGEQFRYVSLFKAPDFKEYWSKVTNEDIQRWGKWLAE